MNWISIRYSPLVGLLLLLSSCSGLVSDKPLSSLRYSERDARLEALWRFDGDEGPSYFYVAYGGKMARGSILSFGKNKNGPVAGSLDFFVTRTAKHAYLNINLGSEKEILLAGSRLNAPKHRDEGYVFMEYHFSWSGQLVMSPLGGEVFSKAVKEGKLRGKTGQFETTIRNERPGRLLAFIEAAKPEDVFMKPPWKARKIGNP